MDEKERKRLAKIAKMKTVKTTKKKKELLLEQAKMSRNITDFFGNSKKKVECHNIKAMEWEEEWIVMEWEDLLNLGGATD